jgi:alkylhydroperoxidase family enzyme
MNTPRVSLIERGAWSPDLLRRFSMFDLPVNILKALANHEVLMSRWNPLANHLLTTSTLTPRQRELVILRTARNVGAEYEWSHHVVFAKKAGIDPEEINRLQSQSTDSAWSDGDAIVLRATDELCQSMDLCDETWGSLEEKFSHKQILDCIFTVGHYVMLGMAIRALRIPLDDGFAGFCAVGNAVTPSRATEG